MSTAVQSGRSGGAFHVAWRNVHTSRATDRLSPPFLHFNYPSVLTVQQHRRPNLIYAAPLLVRITNLLLVHMADLPLHVPQPATHTYRSPTAGTHHSLADGTYR